MISALCFFLTITWAGTAEVHNNFVISFQSTPLPEQPVWGQVRLNFVTVYLLNPEAMKCWFMANTLSTLRDKALHPRDIYSTEFWTCSTVAFCGLLLFFFQANFGIHKMSGLEDFSILSSSLLQFFGKVINYSKWIGHEDLFRHSFKKCKCQKKKLKKLNAKQSEREQPWWQVYSKM